MIIEPELPDMSDPSQLQQPKSALLPDEKTVEPSGPAPTLDLTTLYTNWEKDPVLEHSKDNWKSWSERVGVILRQYNASNYVSSKAYQMVPPDAKGRIHWEGAHNMICGFILTTISPKEIGPFKSITAAKELWESLEEVYNQPGLLSRCDINSKIWNHPFSWSSPITNQLHDLWELVGSLYEQGIPSKNDLYLLAIMWNLNSPDMASKVLPQACTVINSNKSANHNDITCILLQIKTNCKCTNATRVDHAHVATTNKTLKPGAGKGKGPGKPSRVMAKCSNCNCNHDVKYCVAEGGGMAGRDILESIIQQRLDKDNLKGLKFVIGKKTVSIADIATLMSDTKTEKTEAAPTEIASFLADSPPPPSSITSTDFLLDSACTIHVSPFKDDFISLHSVNDHKVQGVNGSTVSAQGVGDILLRDNDGTHITLKDALYIPQSTVCLISIACLINNIPSHIKFDNTNVTIYDTSNNRIASGTRIPGHNLWCVNHAPIPIDSPNISLTTPTLKTWHRCLGHANVQSIYDMAKKGLVTGMKINLSLALPKCDHCILSKQVRSPIPKEREEEHSTRQLGLVYVDLTGPQEVIYANDSKAYRLYHCQTHKVITSFHVQFIESIDSKPRTLRSGKVIDIPPTVIPIIPTTPLTPTADCISTIDPDSVKSEVPQPRRSARIKSKNTSDSANILGEDFVASTFLVADGEAPQPTHNSPSPKSVQKKRDCEHHKMRLAIQNAMATMPQDIAEDFYEIAMVVAVEESLAPTINPASPNDPKSIEEALGCPDGDKWKAAIEEELSSLRDHGVYVLVPRSSVPNGCKVMSSKWVLVSKRDELDIIARWKARLVARGFEQVFGLDFTDTTSSTTRLESLWILLHLAAINSWDIRQLDIKTAYLYGILPEEEIQDMEQPKGFEEPGSTWEFKDLGEAKFCVGIAFTRDRETRKIGLSQTALIKKIATNFLEQPIYPTHSPMDPNVKLQRPDTTEKLSVTDIKWFKALPYRSLVGSMMYIASGSHPDVAYAVSKLAKYLDCYCDVHWDAALRVAQ
ncbi:hypothetical protein NP233_g11548 [Leucocoprinus birnbaumii]|uniref:Reverse transcriptase Ty1/copia-type domain-containing protein n=1 Tax=Leucocoprinus birnbaumii TaxID=56174 RepID=A0AAD5VH94_9AGAR|nr:hypothetical protein NP233_g11548 [Leucocoprinus birnbaumii]